MVCSKCGRNLSFGDMTRDRHHKLVCFNCAASDSGTLPYIIIGIVAIIMLLVIPLSAQEKLYERHFVVDLSDSLSKYQSLLNEYFLWNDVRL